MKLHNLFVVLLWCVLICVQCRAGTTFISYFLSKTKKAADVSVDGNQIETGDSETATHSTTELKLCELREPLLTQ